MAPTVARLARRVSLRIVAAWIGILLGFPAAHAAGSKLYAVEYEIISAALNHGIGEARPQVVIDGRTTGIVINMSPPDITPEALAEELGTTPVALREWSRVNRKRYTLQAQLSLRSDYTLLDRRRRDELFNDEDPAVNWTRFRAALPDGNGIVRVSRPGIDDLGRTALLYLEFECGHECGSGRLINLVQDQADRWQVSSGSLVWITSPEESP